MMLSPDVIVPILRSGILARQFCERVTHANVEAAFERGIYLRCGDDFVCIGEPDIGNGPMTLIGHIRALPLQSLVGQVASICNAQITIGNAVRLTLEHSEPWVPLGWPTCLSAGRLIDVCAALTSYVARGAPPEGLARCVIGSEMPRRPLPLTRVARPRITAFERWLSGMPDAGHAPVAACRNAVADLIGLGPGLTPSGDDFLVGALASLDAVGETEAHVTMAHAILEVLQGRTSPLSACFLKAAAAGHVSENLGQAVSSLMMGDIAVAIAMAGKTGHSSGWDMMAGVLSTLRIVAARRRVTGRAAV